jgi:hypothetical protein
MPSDPRVKIGTPGGEEYEVEAGLDLRTADFINELTLALNLPRNDAEGHPVSWRLDNKDTGRTLDGERTLEHNGVRGGHRLSLIRQVVAGAAFDPRQARLRAEHQRLLALERDSDHVRVEPLVLPGAEPERYRVTLLCRGIARVDGSGAPVYATRHQVEITCDEAFPAEVPRLRWLTDIWHPNIQHAEPRGVCVNKAEWLGGMGLDDLVRQMFEMVQYKNYHADPVWPYPLDQVVARWVREIGEPRGYVNKRAGKFIDDRPFTRPTTGRLALGAPTAPAGPRIRLVGRTTAPVPAAPTLTLAPARIRIVRTDG